jgi:hypothetical protein
MSHNNPHEHEAVIISAAHARERSRLWPGVEKAFLLQNPTCEICGARTGLNVHHRVPFSYVIPLGRPELEFDSGNLATLCTKHDDHHLLIGHLDNFQSYNPDFDQDIKTYAGKSAAAIKRDRLWKQKVLARPAPYHKMTQEQRQLVREFLDRKFPPGVGRHTRHAKMSRT